MGSGSSARSQAEAQDEDSDEDKPKNGKKYRVPGASEKPKRQVTDTSQDTQDEEHVRDGPCDQCGETRKLSRFGGGQWLCTACQLDGSIGSAVMARPRPRRMKDVAGEAPRPVRKSTGQTAEPTASEKPRRRRDTMDSVPSTNGDDGARRRRRGAKDRAAPAVDDASSPPAAARASRIARSATAADLTIVEHRGAYRSAKGLDDLKDKAGMLQRGSSMTDMDEVDSAKAAPLVDTLPPMPKQVVSGGYSVGDRVSSLVSRVRGGLLVLELGNEGAIMGAHGDEAKGDLRLLVQFDSGFDWLLPKTQICATSKLASMKAKGLPTFTWGTRVKCLVTHLQPSRAKREIMLGEAGTVVGPGSTPGKLAVRFDDGAGEWSLWPSLLCEADSYNKAVRERLTGNFSRGERVALTRPLSGSRSCASKRPLPGNEKEDSGHGPHGLRAGDEGTVVGPGHVSGRLLVHFDGDERVWSLLADSLQRASN